MAQSPLPIDTAPSQVATNALQSIPFGSLIGAPLKAAIDAQSTAALSTVNFVKEVGLNTNANGEKEAINVTFTYQQGSQNVNLIVPLLTIVPVPYIRIDKMSIDFKANINAQSSTSLSNSDQSDLNISGKGGLKYLIFSLDISAHYSSKKDSKATADSSYSVEYTMDVSVSAVQDAMPGGLAKVLNILNNSIATANPGGTLSIYATSNTVKVGGSINLELLVVNGENRPVDGAKITPTIEPTSTDITFDPTTLTTDAKGNVKAEIKVAATAKPGTYKISYKNDKNDGTAEQIITVTS